MPTRTTQTITPTIGLEVTGMTADQFSAAHALLASDDEVLRETAVPLVEEARVAFEHFGLDQAARSAEVVRGVAAQNVASIRGRRRSDGSRAS